MASDAVCGLSVRKIHGHGDDLLRLDLKVDGIGHGECAVWHTDTVLPSKCHLLYGVGLDLVDTGGLVQRKRDRYSGDGEVGTAKDVGELETNLVGRCRHVQSLSDRRVYKDSTCLILIYSVSSALTMRE